MKINANGEIIAKQMSRSKYKALKKIAPPDGVVKLTPNKTTSTGVARHSRY